MDVHLRKPYTTLFPVWIRVRKMSDVWKTSLNNKKSYIGINVWIHGLSSIVFCVERYMKTYLALILKVAIN